MTKPKHLPTWDDVKKAIHIKKVRYFKCFRCGHEWEVNESLPTPPIYCASRPCHSPYWFRVKTRFKRQGG